MSPARGPAATIIVPFKDEASVLEATLADFAHSLRADGRHLGDVAVVGVDHASEDGSADAFARGASAAGLTMTEVHACHGGGVVTARRLGFEAAASSFPRSGLFVSLDADTVPEPGWLREAERLVAAGAVAVSYVGTFPSTFWEQVPALTSAYADRVGTVFFDPSTAAAQQPTRTGYHRDLFEALGRTLVDQCFAITPAGYAQAGGHEVRQAGDGSEILHEGGRLAFNLVRSGGRIATAAPCGYRTSPRRLVGEASRLFSGASYDGEMLAFRASADEERLRAELDRSAAGLDYVALRRYVLRNYVLFPLVVHPERASHLEPWLPPGRIDELASDAAAAHLGCRDGFDAIVAAQELDEQLGLGLDEAWGRREG